MAKFRVKFYYHKNPHVPKCGLFVEWNGEAETAFLAFLIGSLNIISANPDKPDFLSKQVYRTEIVNLSKPENEMERLITEGKDPETLWLKGYTP